MVILPVKPTDINNSIFLNEIGKGLGFLKENSMTSLPVDCAVLPRSFTSKKRNSSMQDLAILVFTFR